MSTSRQTDEDEADMKAHTLWETTQPREELENIVCRNTGGPRDYRAA